MAANPLHDIAAWRDRPGPRGIPSICSAHPLAIEAAMRRAARSGDLLLIEATCNQVNQHGGYTGMTPADFRRFAEDIAARTGFDTGRLILGGDHLGPNPWKHLPAEEAMAEAVRMIEAYAAAGFAKLHLDTSMGCAGEPIALPDAITAERAARLAAAAEAVVARDGLPLPVYVIGTEVPVPGGALEELDTLEVTRPEAARETVAIHAAAFAAAGAEAAFARVVAAVVQPGVEFGNENVIAYDPAPAEALSATLADLPGLVFEAHSTDYQTPEALRRLVTDGFAILKVGPGLTFALREAFYSLDRIAEILRPEARAETLQAAMERIMTARPDNWAKYYHGDADALRLQRHFSYSDRIRYYWPDPEAEAAVTALLAALDGIDIPETLVSQHLARLYGPLRRGEVAPRARDLALASIDLTLADYFAACRP